MLVGDGLIRRVELVLRGRDSSWAVTLGVGGRGTLGEVHAGVGHGVRGLVEGSGHVRRPVVGSLSHRLCVKGMVNWCSTMVI